MKAETIARELGGHRSGAGFVAKCPAHDDRNPSLSITERAGRILCKCHAGCDQAAVVEALKERGLWPESNHAEEWVEWRPGIRYPAAWGRVVTSYDYKDESGEFLYSVVRFDPKDFRPGYLTAANRWKWGKHPRPVPYRLNEVLESPIVFIVEGEKDVETLRSWGFCATTAAGGCNGWRDDFAEYFIERECILIPDHDEPGLAWAKRVAHSLLGKAARICILFPLPGLKGKDISDWFAQGHSEVELIHLVERDLTPEAPHGS